LAEEERERQVRGISSRGILQIKLTWPPFGSRFNRVREEYFGSFTEDFYQNRGSLQVFW
jgi:hypothetical protein